MTAAFFPISELKPETSDAQASTEPPAADSIQARVDKSLAVAEYVRALKQFEVASTRFNEACCRVRSVIGNNAKFVVKVDFTTYLVLTEEDGDFEIEPITQI